MWLATNKALLVDGARQVEKTYLIDAFCKKHFENYIYTNLALNPQEIPAFSASPLIPSKTITFIDEIRLAKNKARLIF